MGGSVRMSDIPDRASQRVVATPPQEKNYVTNRDIDPNEIYKNSVLKQYIHNLYNADGTLRKGRQIHEFLHKNIWKGRRVFVIGGGPSLRGFDFEKLRGEICITVNRAFEQVPWSVLNIAQDARVWGYYENGTLGEEAKKRFQAYKGFKVWVNVQPFPFPEDIYTIPVTHPDDFNWKKLELAAGIPIHGNSGLNALIVAACMNPEEIYLLGFDMKGENGRTSNYHEGYPDWQTEDVYKPMIREFNDVAYRLNGARKIYNLNPDSGIRCFDFADVDRLRPIKRPLYVSYYTEGTGYQLEIKRLEESLIKFGLEYKFRAIGDRGSWRKNIHERIKILRDFLDEEQRDIVYIDADGAVQQYPVLFDDFKDDMGIVKIDRSKYWDNWKEFHPDRYEYLGGTMYFKNNDRVRKMLARWEELDAPMKTALSQHTLIHALEEHIGKGLKVQLLPLTYTQIFDTMADEGEPVVEHFQASRRSIRCVKIAEDGSYRLDFSQS